MSRFLFSRGTGFSGKDAKKLAPATIAGAIAMRRFKAAEYAGNRIRAPYHVARLGDEGPDWNDLEGKEMNRIMSRQETDPRSS